MPRALLGVLLLLAAALPLRAATDTLQPVKESLANEVAGLARDDMHFRIHGRKLAIAPFRNDPDSIVTKALRDAISSKGEFEIVEPSTLREIWDKIVGNDKEAPLTAKQAVELGKKLGAECVLFGRVESLMVDENGAFCDLKIRIVQVNGNEAAHVKEGDGVFIGRYRTNLKKGLLSVPYFRVWMADTSKFVRCLIWAVALLILPFMTLLARETLSQAAPIVPIGIILVITAVDMFLALLMMGFEAGSVLSWAMLVGALAVSIFYNLTILAKVAQLQLPGRDA